MAMKDSITQFNQAVKKRLRLPTNQRHALLGYQDKRFTAQPAVVESGIVETTLEAQTQQGINESFATVFERWTRISRSYGGDSLSDTYREDELDAWTFNEQDNTLICTVNSVSLLGFISPEVREDFVFEVALSSTDNDDDFIGLCIAHAIDSDGNTHILTVMRQLNGAAPLIIEKDRNGFGGGDGPWSLTVFADMLWANRQVADGPGGGNVNGMWRDLDNPIMLKVTRSGDEITVETGQTHQTGYHEPARTVFNLTDDPELEVFRGPQAFGYVCASQRFSTWKTFQRPQTFTPIINREDYSVLVYDDVNDTWNQVALGIEQAVAGGYLLNNTLHVNPATLRYYYLPEGGTLEAL